MEDYSEYPYKFISTLCIVSIIFDDSRLVIRGYDYNKRTEIYSPVELDCSFSFFTDIMLFADDDKIDLIAQISERLLLPFDEPEQIEVELLLGEPLKIQGPLVRTLPPIHRKKVGIWCLSSENFYIVDTVLHGKHERPIDYDDICSRAEDLMSGKVKSRHPPDFQEQVLKMIKEKSKKDEGKK